jgi:hypothetical protein
MAIVATLATEKSLPDLQIFLKTLQLWNGTTPPTVYMFVDKAVASTSFSYRGIVHQKECLTRYSSYTRSQMERLPGRYGSLWAEFMAEKISLLEWVFSSAPDVATTAGVFFFDADICFLGPLPTIPPETTIALSPHMIRLDDEAKYGTFNGGFLWMRAASALGRWRAACESSRFFEQAALETFADDGGLYTFPIQSNYGWWRLWQSEDSPEQRMRNWSIRRGDEKTAGILVEGSPLLSIHTHFGGELSIDVQTFNSFVVSFLKKLATAKYMPAKKLLQTIGAALN